MTDKSAAREQLEQLVARLVPGSKRDAWVAVLQLAQNPDVWKPKPERERLTPLPTHLAIAATPEAISTAKQRLLEIEANGGTDDALKRGIEGAERWIAEKNNGSARQ